MTKVRDLVTVNRGGKKTGQFHLTRGGSKPQRKKRNHVHVNVGGKRSHGFYLKG